MTWTILETGVDQWFRHRSARLGAKLACYSDGAAKRALVALDITALLAMWWL